jgi:cytochrome bd-type quinol oxidase subunit 2
MKNGGVYFSALVTALLGALFLLLVFESWALLYGQTPITGYVRGTVHAYPGGSFVAAIVIGMVIGHVLWGGPAAIARLRRGK